MATRVAAAGIENATGRLRARRRPGRRPSLRTGEGGLRRGDDPRRRQPRHRRRARVPAAARAAASWSSGRERGAPRRRPRWRRASRSSPWSSRTSALSPRTGEAATTICTSCERAGRLRKACRAARGSPPSARPEHAEAWANVGSDGRGVRDRQPEGRGGQDDHRRQRRGRGVGGRPAGAARRPRPAVQRDGRPRARARPAAVVL